MSIKLAIQTASGLQVVPLLGGADMDRKELNALIGYL
jgi:hypothetical protein